MIRHRLVTLILVALTSYSTCLNAATNSKKQASKTTGSSSSQTRLPEQGAKPFVLRPDVMAQAADIAERRSLPPEWTADMLGQARRLPSVARR